MWMMNFVDNVIHKMDADVYILPNCVVQEKFWKYYREQGVNLLSDTKVFKRYTEDVALRHWLRDMCVYRKTLNALRGMEQFDIINLHYVSIRELSLLSKLKRDKEKFILSYYGSDLLRQNMFLLWYRKRYVRKADVATFDNGDLQRLFQSIYGKRSFGGKQYLLPFGLPILDRMKTLKRSLNNEAAKQKLGILSTDVTIAIGYNGKPEQHHLDILNELGKLDSVQKDNILIIIQMTYGATEEYKGVVMKKAIESGCKVEFFEEYLPDEDIAIIRLATDIYINAQKTDAFSGSVCENLYGGCILINADWLMYEEFKKEPFDFITFKQFSELRGIIQKIIQNEISVDKMRNEQLIWKMRSWEICKEKWIDVLSGRNKNGLFE